MESNACTLYVINDQGPMLANLQNAVASERPNTGGEVMQFTPLEGPAAQMLRKKQPKPGPGPKVDGAGTIGDRHAAEQQQHKVPRFEIVWRSWQVESKFFRRLKKRLRKGIATGTKWVETKIPTPQEPTLAELWRDKMGNLDVCGH